MDSLKNSRVHVLNPLVAERIAAGEVIERPASVVKELVENSLDAGATEITVCLEDGGKALIEVLDNGHGIFRDDLKVCIQRHATSKLNSLSDLEKIATLGFRGEALPSVGAVADLTLLSRTASSDTAYQLRVHSMQADPEPEAVTFGHFLSSQHGTRIQARGLFSQVPARLKFLKSQAAEVGQVREWIERLALAHPQTGFQLISDQRSILKLRPQDEVARVKAILSDGDSYPVVSANNDLGFRDREKGDLHIRAHWLQGLSSPQTRRVLQVVNGRSVKDRLLQQAILSAFKQSLLPGQFPAIAVYIEIDPAQIDVNVHPTKTEIRFLESRKIFHALESLISSMIEKNGAPAFVPTQKWGAYESTPNFSFTTPPTLNIPSPQTTSTFSRQEMPSISSHSDSPTAPSLSTPSQAARLGLTAERFMGTSFNTYLFYDLGEELVLIDQHAAHERIRYEKLRTRATDPACANSRQALLLPEAVHFDSEQRGVLEGRLSWLDALGFEAEIFGETALLFRAIPGEWGAYDLRTRLKNLVERIAELDANTTLPQVFMDENLFEKLASEACHSAIRAGDRLERVEALELIEQLFQCEHPWNCPHGRPTVARVPKGKIEEWFLRRV